MLPVVVLLVVDRQSRSTIPVKNPDQETRMRIGHHPQAYWLEGHQWSPDPVAMFAEVVVAV